MFPLPGHTVIFQDKPDGVPVMASFLAAESGSGIELDEMKRSQLWDVPDADQIINDCKYTILVNTMLGAALPYTVTTFINGAVAHAARCRRIEWQCLAVFIECLTVVG